VSIDGFVKSPSAALHFTFVVATYLKVRLSPQLLCALHLELFTKPSFCDLLRDRQYLVLIKQILPQRAQRQDFKKKLEI
jgi:hypothetical protein